MPLLGVCSYQEGLTAVGAEIDRAGVVGFILREEDDFLVVTPLRRAELGQHSIRLGIAELGALASRRRSEPGSPAPDTYEARLAGVGADLDAAGARNVVLKFQAGSGYASFRPTSGLPVRRSYAFGRAPG